MAECTFCRIIAGELPAHVVLDDDTCMAFLDVRPLFPGHTLLVTNLVAALPGRRAARLAPAAVLRSE